MTFPADRQVIVGRDPDADVVVPDPDVSWHHCELHSEGQHWQLADLHSTNGTWHSNGRIEQLALVGPTRIRVGERNVLEIEPCQPAEQFAPTWTERGIGRQSVSAGILVPIVTGVLLVAVGVFVLDWYDLDIVIRGFGRTQRSAGLQLDSDTIGLASSAIAAAVGILGWKETMPPRIAGALIVCTATVAAGTAAYLMYGPPAADEVTNIFELSATVHVSLALGGFVTLAGCLLLIIAGFMLLARPNPA
jgi:hypothetical protein